MKIVDIALSQEGTPENGLNNVEYNTWYYGYPVSGGSYPYCAVFVAWCAKKAGLSTEVIPRTASVMSLYNFFLERDLFRKMPGYIPSPGDIMIQRQNGASHTGIVIMADSKGFQTIEGNAGRGVERCYHRYYDPELTGFGTPKYPIEVITKWSSQTPKNVDSFIRMNALSVTAGSDTSTTPTTNITSPQMSETEVWDWFRAHGYSTSATAGIMGRLKCETDQYNCSYETIRTLSDGRESGGMGMFQWTWDGGRADSLEQGMQDYPDSRLAKYLTWCQTNNREAQNCLSQLDYFWEVDLDEQAYFAQKKAGIPSFRPEDMNDLTPEQAARAWTDGYERGCRANEEAESLTLFAQYKDRPVTNVISSTGEKTDTAMRGGTIATRSGVGRYTYTEYSVKAGDTLESIAAEFNIAPQMILFANDLESWDIDKLVRTTIWIPQASQILSHTDAISNVDSLEYLKHTMSVTVSHPSVEIFFYGEYGMLAAKSTLDKTTQNEYVDFDVINVNTMRSMGSDCPTFSMSLVWRNEWYKNLASNDLVVIHMQRPPEANHVVMYGLIDDIRRVLDWSSGQPQRAVQVTGRGLNKALCYFDIGLIDMYSNLDYGMGFFARLAELGNCGSSQGIDLVLSAYLDRGMKYKFGNGKSFTDYFQYLGTPLPNELLVDQKSFATFVGNIWNFIKQLGNAPFNETFWEIAPDSEDGTDKATLIHRPTPFEKNDWVALNRITIKDDDLVSNNTGRSDLETYTVYKVQMKVWDEATDNLFLPLWYPPYYSKYGLRELKIQSLYQANPQSATTSNYNPIVFTTKLFNFNIKNNIMENGSITVKGSNQYKVGERVILESEDMEYYVEGVGHNFNMYSSWITTLQVTRGLHPTERFTPPYGAAEDLTPTVMFNIMQLTKGTAKKWYDLPEREWGTINASGISTTAFNGTSMVGADGLWYSFQGLTMTHPSPQCLIITSPYGPRTPPAAGASSYHKGIDLACEGSAKGLPIVAAADGTVTYAGPGDGYGNYIEIDHGSGVTTRYAHMQSGDILVSQGQTVTAGQHIANIGNAGITSGGEDSGHHLHFELRINGEPIDPERMFEERTTAPESVKLQATEDAAYAAINVDASEEELAKSCYDYITQRMGLSKCAACAILGNIEQESTFNMVALNGSSKAYGLCQWTDSRKTALFAYCANHGLEVNTVAGQMGFLYEELQTTEQRGYQILKNAANGTRNDVNQVAVSFGEAFERYSKEYNEEGSRGTYAVKWWDYFS